MDDNAPQLSETLGRQVLSLLLFDEKQGPFIRNVLPMDAWANEPNIHMLAKTVYKHIDTYKKVPGDHVYNIIEEMKVKEESKELLTSLVEFCEICKVNSEYVIDKLEHFLRQSVLKEAVTKAVDMIDRGELDQVESILTTALKKRVESFQKGTTLQDGILKLYLEDETNINDRCHLMIPALDIRDLVPTRKELYVIAAETGGGKSWGLVHCGKAALAHGFKVLYLTGELSEDVVLKRFLQSMFGVAKKNMGPISRAVLNNGAFVWDTTYPTRFLDDTKTLDELSSRIERTPRYNNLVIKQFPTGGMSIHGMLAYLDALENDGFVPDMVIVDYADLMDIGDNFDNMRVALGHLYKKLRGVAIERNVMMVTASQLNRVGAASKKKDATHIAEDYSKVGTCDTLLTINKTDEEKSIGIARIYVAKGRNSEDRFEFLVEQNFNIGQFCMESTDRMTSSLQTSLNNFIEQEVHGGSP